MQRKMTWSYYGGNWDGYDIAIETLNETNTVYYQILQFHAIKTKTVQLLCCIYFPKISNVTHQMHNQNFVITKNQIM